MDEYDIEQLIASVGFVWEDLFENHDKYIEAIKSVLKDYNQ